MSIYFRGLKWDMRMRQPEMKNLLHYIADLVNTEEDGKQDLLLLEAFSCGRSAA
jgi:hypothetical protein